MKITLFTSGNFLIFSPDVDPLLGSMILFSMNMKKISAWSVHFYTASGGIMALASLIEIERNNWPAAMAWLFASFFVDGSDGFLARRFKVSEELPGIDGGSIDYVIDFLTYAFIPAYFVYSSGMVTDSLAFPTSAFILLTSAIYYGKKNMVSDQKHFNGFPVLWNLVVFYAFFVFRSGPVFNLVMIIFFGVLHFIPIQVSYPSRNRSNGGKMLFAVSLLLLLSFLLYLYTYPEPHWILILIAYGALGYFSFLTIWYSWIKKDWKPS